MVLKKYIIAAVILVALILTIAVQCSMLNSVRSDRDRWKSNSDAMLTGMNLYRTKDSLSASQVSAVTLSLAEYKKYHAEDKKLIDELKRSRNVDRIVSVGTDSRVEFKTLIKDSIIYRETTKIDSVKCIDLDTKWYSIHGCIIGDSLKGNLRMSDAVKIIETITYKRFLGFLWKTSKIKNRQVDVVSLNPYTTIISADYSIIK